LVAEIKQLYVLINIDACIVAQEVANRTWAKWTRV